MRAPAAEFLALALPAVLALTALSAPLAAGSGLVASLGSPSSVAQGQAFTVQLAVANNLTTTAQLSPTLGSAESGPGLTLLSGPSPAAIAVPPTFNTEFTWTFSAAGCGTVAFTASATDASTGSASNVASASVGLACPASPTPTPGWGALTPVPSEKPTVVVTPTPAPLLGSAMILGNVFHPLEGGTVALQFDEPYATTVDIGIYDRVGHRVKHISVDASPGQTTIDWDGRGDDGLVVASGIYIAYFQGRGLSSLLKLAVIK